MSKKKDMNMGFKPNIISILGEGVVENYRYLGVKLDDKLNWKKQH